MTVAKISPTGKHVVITGGASGIGLEIGRCLAERGAASLSIFDISQSALTVASDSLKALSSHTQIHTYQVDVTKYSEVLAAVQSAQQRCGRLDIVFANAGIGPGGKFADKTSEFYEKLISVNYMGVVHTLKAALPTLAKQDSGHVMVTNSLAGYAGVTGLSAYCASKFAVRGLVETLRLEFMGTNVHFHMACPGFTDTSMMQHSRATTLSIQS
ncbi:hypothetical protein WJX73_004357 [Symbiochloris irregularis]|uniref:Ketoreductase domain-containing protein n=1 Tax=Symbiochloris irregularis TaxID=706552 RepID=A0AAW1NQV6_9CHLO